MSQAIALQLNERCQLVQHFFGKKTALNSILQIGYQYCQWNNPCRTPANPLIPIIKMTFKPKPASDQNTLPILDLLAPMGGRHFWPDHPLKTRCFAMSHRDPVGREPGRYGLCRVPPEATASPLRVDPIAPHTP